MPTGYTAALISKNFDLKKWLKEDVSRNFGMLVCLRDDGNLNEDEILNKLENNSSYYKTAKNKCLEQIKHLKESDKKELEKEFLLKQKQSKENREKRITEIKEEVSKFNKVKQDLYNISKNASGEVLPNVLSFAISQINSHLEYDGDYSYYEKPSQIENQTFEEWLILENNKLEKDLIRYNEEFMKEQERNINRINAYKELIKFIDDNI